MSSNVKVIILKEIKEKHKVDISNTNYSLCENAAHMIAKSMAARKKETLEKNKDDSIASYIKYYSDQVSKAANTVSNQNGATEANLQFIIAAIVIFAILCMIYREQYTDSSGVHSMWDNFKNFKVGL